MRAVLMMMVALAIVAILQMSFGLAASAAVAATLIVNDLGDESDATLGDGQCATAGGVCTLRAAIEEANTLAGTDVIEFALPNESTIAVTGGELLITESVRINGPGMRQLAINTGFNFQRIFHIAPGADAIVHISSLNIRGSILPVGNGAGILLVEGTLHLNQVELSYNVAQNGSGGGVAVEGGTLFVSESDFNHNSAAEAGGGSYAMNGNVTITNDTRFSYNSAIIGGGIYSEGYLFVENSEFIENEAEYSGGAIRGGGQALTLYNSILNGNRAHFGAGLSHDSAWAQVAGSQLIDNESSGDGGAIYNSSALLVDTSIFRDNSAQNGGGIRNSGTLTITNTTLEENLALSRGGGILNVNQGLLTLNQSTLVGNRTEGAEVVDKTGGAINNFDATAIINNSTLSGNFSEEYAGAIFTYGGTTQINNSSVVFNHGVHSGGLEVGSMGLIQVRNSIIARNEGGDCEITAANPNGIMAFNANLDSDGSCPLFTLSDEEPVLGLLQNNGGQTPTHLPDPLSPALGAGSIDGCAVVGNVDQRGFVRMNPGDSGCDLGAVERDGMEPTPTPTMTSTPTATATATATPTATGTATPTVTPTVTPDPSLELDVPGQSAASMFLPKVE